MTTSDDTFLRAGAASCERGPARVRAVSLSIQPGALTLLGGGAEKNLMLRLLGLLETPDAGEVFFQNAGTRSLDDAARLALRNRHFGFVFTEPFLLEGLSVAENVAMPLFKISGVGLEEARRHTERLLGFVGLREREGASGLCALDSQKVSLARALAHRPEVLVVENVDAHLCDRALAEFLALLRAAKSEFGVTVIATAAAAEDFAGADRAVTFADGVISRDTLPAASASASAPA